jgi:hypothetical protein
MKIVLVIYLAKKIVTIFKKYALIKICVEFKKKKKIMLVDLWLLE